MWNAKFKLGRSDALQKANLNRITVVKHAVLRDIVVSDWSSGKKSSETDSDETGTKLEVF